MNNFKISFNKKTWLKFRVSIKSLKYKLEKLMKGQK